MSNLIAIDWGTSSFRMYLMGSKGEILQTISTGDGILSISNQTFELTLSRHLEKLEDVAPDTPIIASGMITSKKGWCETPYAMCPADVGNLAEKMVPQESDHHGTIWFVPGIKQHSPHPDIMRGEETQLAGIGLEGEFTAIMPGTHSKWVKMNSQCLKEFTTFMTGELFSIIMDHSILGTPVSGNWNDKAFKEGVRLGYNSDQKSRSLLSDLFQIRARTILGIDVEEQTRSLVSGILIGTEISGALRSGFETTGRTCLIGDENIVNHYTKALKECGVNAEIIGDTASSRGLFRIAQQKQLI